MATTIAVALVEGQFYASRFGDAVDEKKFQVIFKVSTENGTLEELEAEARAKARSLGIGFVNNLDPDP